MTYEEFLDQKKLSWNSTGISTTTNSPHLFDFQRDIVNWALKKGRCAIFAGTGLGKTRMQLEWSNHIPGDVLILAPLAVSMQTVAEGKMIGIHVNLCKENEDVKPGINITNYERIERFDIERFAGIVLDESSILKAQTGKTRNLIIELFKNTPFKLACTATPAPNDHMEIGNHAEFLGIMTATEMLSMFFVHDGGDTAKWRIKGHAVQRFWEWVAGWAVMLTNPSELGYDGSAFELPPLNIQQITVTTEPKEHEMFVLEAQTLQERQQARRDSQEERIMAAADIVAQRPTETWLIWCNLNSESDLLQKTINCATEVKGSDSADHKEQSMLNFAAGVLPVMVSKPSICGFGMNFQVCHNMIFVGLSDSFEEYYQAVRRCWRFGQTEQVNVYVVTADREGAVVANIERKERDFTAMLTGMISATQEITKENIQGTGRDEKEYAAKHRMILPIWMGEYQ